MLATDSFAILNDTFGELAPYRATVCRWFAAFLKDDPRHGRLADAVTTESVAIARRLIEENRNITCIQL